MDIYIRDEDGYVIGERVFRVTETTGSEAYVTSYAVLPKGITDEPDYKVKAEDVTMVREQKFYVKNTIDATNTANIAAVKQLLNREWLSEDADGENADRYTFKLTPVGQGTYDTDGELAKDTNGIIYVKKTDGTNQVDTDKVPMPDDYISKELDGVPDNTTKALAAKVTKFKDTTKPDTEEVVGEGERLARFGGITYKLSDLVYDEHDAHMQGDFFYTISEEIPADAVNANGKKGVTYDDKTHTVHVKVRENQTTEPTNFTCRSPTTRSPKAM